MADIADLAEEVMARQFMNYARAVVAAASAVQFCLDCGGAIGAARKAAMPSATRCISCATALEAHS